MPNANFFHDYFLSCDLVIHDFISQLDTLSHLETIVPVGETLLRISTDRNSSKRLKTCKRPPTYQKVREKPYLIFQNMPKSFKDQLRKWNNQRAPGLRVKIPPPGFEYQLVPSGEYELVKSISSDEFGHISKRWKDKLIQRLVPLPGTSRRKKPSFSGTLINDLHYFHSYSLSIKIQALNASQNKFLGFEEYLDGDEVRLYMINGDVLAFPWTNYGLPSNPVLHPSVVVANETDLLIQEQNTIDELSEIALRRHYTKLGNKKIDLATELSQAFQVVNMVVDLGIRVAKSLLLMKKGRVMDSLGTLLPSNSKALAKDYLAWIYGIKPLMSDAFGAAEQLAEFILRAAPVKSNGHAKRVSQSIVPWSCLTALGRFSVGELLTRSEVRVKFGSEFVISDELTRSASQLGFTNPANVVWELVPFSFVVDWFLPIGNWLNSLTDLNGLSFKQSYKTVFIKRTYVFAMRTTPGEMMPGFLLEGNQSSSTTGFKFSFSEDSWSYSWEWTTVYCKREVIPLPGLPLPSFKNPASKTHITNALALFRSLM